MHKATFQLLAEYNLWATRRLLDENLWKDLNQSRYKTDFENPIAEIYRQTGKQVKRFLLRLRYYINVEIRL